MPFFTRRSRNNIAKSKPANSAPPAVESLESRAMLSADIIVTVAGPLPQSEISGVTINKKIGINVANSGPDRASGRGLITLFASLDNTLSIDDAQITTGGIPLNVPAGRNHTFRLNVKAFPQNLNGNYFILGEVSGGNIATTLASSTTTINIIPPEIDLANTFVSAPINGHIGHKIPVTVDLTNSGNVPAKGSLAVAFSLSESPTGTSPFAIGTISRHIILRAGARTVLHFMVPVPFGAPSGNQYVVADVDPSNVFLEPNLVNNVMVSLTPVSVS